MKKILIPIIQKNGKKSSRYIKSSNKKYYNYNRKLKYYIKKSKIEIGKIKFQISSRKKEKIAFKKSKKQVQKRKEKLIEKKIKEKSQKPKSCNFNYTQFYKGINHNGYVRIQNTDIIITEDSTNHEILEILDYILNFVHKEFFLLPCPQRMSYFKIHYRIQLSNNIDDIRDSSNTTQTSFNIKDLSNNIETIFYNIVNMVESYIMINIYKLELVNYEFKSVLGNEKII